MTEPWCKLEVWDGKRWTESNCLPGKAVAGRRLWYRCGTLLVSEGDWGTSLQPPRGDLEKLKRPTEVSLAEALERSCAE